MSEIEDSLMCVGAGTEDSNHRKSTTAVIKCTIGQTTDAPRKIVLPRRPGESRFAPSQYYYPASRSGVMPGGNAR
jgi:hypothetical protein